MQYVGSKNRLSKELAPIIKSYITIVLISEYSMPDDFKCIWEKELKLCLEVVLIKIVTKSVWKSYLYIKVNLRTA